MPEDDEPATVSVLEVVGCGVGGSGIVQEHQHLIAAPGVVYTVDARSARVKRFP